MNEERSLILRPSHELNVRIVPGRVLSEMVTSTLTLAREVVPATVDFDALVREGKRIQSGQGMTPENIRAFKLFFQAATAKHPEAQYLVSECYGCGRGIEENQSESLGWLQKSAESGFAEAQSALGDRYYEVREDFGPLIEGNKKV